MLSSDTLQCHGRRAHRLAELAAVRAVLRNGSQRRRNKAVHEAISSGCLHFIVFYENNQGYVAQVIGHGRQDDIGRSYTIHTFYHFHREA